MNLLFLFCFCGTIAHALSGKFRPLTSLNNFLGTKIENVETFIGDKTAAMGRALKSGYNKVVNYWSHRPIEEPEHKIENPDVILSVPSTITRNGYYCETHTVLSQGYMLNVHRIARSKNFGDIPKRTVLLQHGLFGSSADWILNGPEKALGYVLADAGYDVWMSNVRGNRYAKEHILYKSTSKTFWNFSWHDIALHDIPAVIDHILKIKGNNSSITYIGHSMGTTILFAMLTLRPEYNNILKAGFALAPVSFFTDVKSPMKLIAPIATNIAYIDLLRGVHDFLPKNSVLGKMTSACKVDHIDSFCKDVVFYICGSNEAQYNSDLLPMFITNLGTGTSWKTAVHFAQEYNSGGRFQYFDYGHEENIKLYGSDTPPEYDLSKITLPIKLFWAENDLLSSETDVRLLYEKLPDSKQIYKVPDPAFNHMDYLWAIDAPTLVNDEILLSLEQVNSS